MSEWSNERRWNLSMHRPGLPLAQLLAVCVMLGKCLPLSEPQLLNGSGGPEAFR